jgi:hypothetical protein
MTPGLCPRALSVPLETAQGSPWPMRPPRMIPAHERCSHDSCTLQAHIAATREPGRATGRTRRGAWREPTDSPGHPALKRRLVAERPLAVTLGDVYLRLPSHFSSRYQNVRSVGFC